jgi:gliding motility-associated protein GldM
MAGVKETPRQKLIGMMYLVLLALLALQVSSSIIQKFQFLNESIVLSNGNLERSNKESLKSIAAAVEKNKNAVEDVAVLKTSESLRSNTQGMLDYLQALKKELILASGGDKDESGNYPGAKQEESVAQVMLGGDNAQNAKGTALKIKLNAYIDALNNYAKAQKLDPSYHYIALDGKEDPVFKNDPEQKNKDFAHLNFESTPLVAALAVISEKESQILNFESHLLNQLAKKVGAVNIPVDKLRPVVSTSSSYVVAGMEYQADMFMAAYSSNYQPKMTKGGQAVQVSRDGIGSVKFRAGSNTFDENGLSKQSWLGTISFPKANGQDSIYTVKQDYYVVRPAIQVQSAAVQALYRNCGNELNVSVPALGAQFNPEYTITGGTLVRTGAGKITVIPTDRNVKISVSNNGVPIGQLDYKAKAVPFANFEINLNQKTGASVGSLSNVSCKAKAPDEFSELLPKEDKYYLDEIKVYLVRRGRMIKETTIKGGSGINLATIKEDAQSGDVIVFEVTKASRRNYQGRLEEAKINNPLISISVR